MRKYWIIVDGKPAGPFTTSDLRVRNDFKRGLPVWYNDLTAWTVVEEVPELASLLEDEEPAEPQQPEPQSAPSPASPPPLGAQRPFSAWVNVMPQMVNGEKRPATYVGWSIIMLLCCCMPMGVLGLIFGSMVNRRFYRGDIEGAKKASEYAAWCIIIGIVVSLISIPFTLVYSLP